MRSYSERIAEFKPKMQGRWPDFFASKCNVDLSILDGKGHPCPKCGGDDRFHAREIDVGALYCRGCLSKGCGDGLAATMWLLGIKMFPAIELIEEFCGIEKPKPAKTRKKIFATLPDAVECVRDVAEGVAKQKSVGTEYWTYEDAEGKIIGVVARVNFSDGSKTYRPIHSCKSGWKLGDPPGGFPLYGLRSVLQSKKIYLVEGEKAAEAAKSIGLDATTTAHGAKGIKKCDLSALAGKEIVGLPDNDAPGDAYIAEAAAQCSRLNPPPAFHVKRLPDAGPKDDIYDFVVLRRSQGKSDEEIRDEIEPLPCEQPPVSSKAEKPTQSKEHASEIDPAEEVRRFLGSLLIDGVAPLAYWRETWLLWEDSRYRIATQSEVEGLVVRFLDRSYFKVSTGTISSVMKHLRAQACLSSAVEPPCWIRPISFGWAACDMLAMKNHLVHLPSVIAGKEYRSQLTPRLLSMAALDFDFNLDAPSPGNWLNFLQQLWRKDQESIDLLQEWMGYCLLPDTRYQKMLLLIGPRRSGKGTIARLLTELIGKMNVASPTFASLSQNFGLWPIISKLLAIFPDARLSFRTDHAVITERLLSITGEDQLTIDRKYLEPLTCKLPTRLMVLTNELPKLPDSSGALAGRFLILKTKRSFYGKEDPDLTGKLLNELPGILLWAIEGWRRLRERGRFVQPRSSQEMLREIYDLGNPIAAFVRERCVRGPEFESTVDDLYRAWLRWCEAANRHESGNKQTFGRDLVSAIPAIRRARPRVATGDRVRVYRGVGIKA